MQASDMIPFEPFEGLHEKYLNAVLQGDTDLARDVIRERDNLVCEPVAEELSEIIFYYQNKFKFFFKEIHQCSDKSYIVQWRETDKQLEKLRVNHVNNWLHEKVQPLIQGLPAAAKKYEFVLEMMTQPSPGKFSLWMSSPDGAKIYSEYQAF